MVYQFIICLFLSCACYGADESVVNKVPEIKKNEAPFLIKFKNTYICPETGLTMEESEKASLDCKTGSEILEIIQLMIGAGWAEERIEEKFQYFIQGRQLMIKMEELQPCIEEGRLNLKFFIMPYCPFGTKFVDEIFHDIINDLGDYIEWHPYMIFLKDKDGNLTAMHGEKEREESIRQICIREKWGKGKWLDYFGCFSAHIFSDKTKDWQACAEDVGINIDELALCVKEDSEVIAEKEYLVAEKYRAFASPTSIYDCHKGVTGAMPYNRLKPAICSCFTGKKPDTCP